MLFMFLVESFREIRRKNSEATAKNQLNIKCFVGTFCCWKHKNTFDVVLVSTPSNTAKTSPVPALHACLLKRFHSLQSLPRFIHFSSTYLFSFSPLTISGDTDTSHLSLSGLFGKYDHSSSASF